MRSHILVPYDGSAFAERALPAALAIARRFGAALELVHVHEPLPPSGGAPMYDTRLDLEARAAVCHMLEALEQRLAATEPIPIALTCLTGTVGATLEAHIAGSSVDLVVMSTHGAGGLRRSLLGSVADHLVRHVHVPVLLVRPGASGPRASAEPLFAHILLPLDGSDLAAQVIEPALAFASPGGTVLTLLHVVTVPTALGAMPNPSGGVPLFPTDLDDRQRQIVPYLDAVAAGLVARGFTTHTVVQPHTRVPRCILDVADERDVDLIAMSTHGLGGIRRAMLGSVTDAVAREATRTVLAFRPDVPSS